MKEFLNPGSIKSEIIIKFLDLIYQTINHAMIIIKFADKVKKFKAFLDFNIKLNNEFRIFNIKLVNF